MIYYLIYLLIVAFISAIIITWSKLKEIDDLERLAFYECYKRSKEFEVTE